MLFRIVVDPLHLKSVVIFITTQSSESSSSDSSSSDSSSSESESESEDDEDKAQRAAQERARKAAEAAKAADAWIKVCTVHRCLSSPFSYKLPHCMLFYIEVSNGNASSKTCENRSWKY
jgi:hypothetical protein